MELRTYGFALMGIGAIASMLLGAFVAHAVGGNTPVTEDEFTSEVRLLREKIFELKQEALEQKILNASAQFGGDVTVASVNQDANLIKAACGTAQANSSGFADRWKEILDFWPLPADQANLGPLTNFNKDIAQFCPAVAPAQ